MDEKDFSKYRTGRYQEQIRWYDNKATRNQRLYRWGQWLLILLASITPFLIELDLKPVVVVRWATLTSAAVAILTASLKTFKYQEHWISYRTTCESLRKEEHFYSAQVGDYRSATDKEALFVERVEALISQENTIWISTARPHVDTKEQK